MLHLIKLAVGVADPPALAARPAVVRTRNFPRRADEILEGGSMYWVMSGVLLCRQQVAGISTDRRDDGTPCTAIILDGPPVAVVPRMVRPFQGWRYLTPADAPDDLDRMTQAAGDPLPPALRRALAALCLL